MSQNVNVNLVPGNYPKEFHVSQYDVGRQLVANIVDSTGAYSIPSGATVTLVGTKPSGFGFTLSGSVGSGGVVTFSTTATVTAEYGRIPCELRITSGDTVLGTANLMLIVEESPHQEGVIDGNSETVIPELTILVERVEAAASNVLDMQVEADTLPAGSSATYSYNEETNTATFGIPQGEAGAGTAGVVASACSASSTYAVGDYVIHDGNLYRCTTAITTAEAFTAAHWTQVVLGDDVSDLKSDLQEITEETTSEGFDESDNLVDGLTLSPNYYPNGGNAPYSNANFSYLGMDVTGITKLKINGTHHIYTVTQLPSMGVFLDSENTWLADVRDQAVDLSSFPIVANVPNGATKLYLNTDYKASDYPSTLPSDLYVYPWRTNVESIKVPYSALEKTPVTLADLSQGDKKIKIIAGVIRNSGNGWEYINDSGHEPLNLTSVSVDSYGRIKIDYGFTASKVLSLVATPDETFAGQYAIGGSVGLENSLFNVYSLPRVYGGMVRVNNGVVDATASTFTSAEIKTTGEIRLYHPSLSGTASKEVFNIQASSPNYETKLGSQGFDYVSLYVYSNGRKITDFTGLSFDIYAMRNVNTLFINANNIVDAGGNFWIYGVMEI